MKVDLYQMSRTDCEALQIDFITTSYPDMMLEVMQYLIDGGVMVNSIAYHNNDCQLIEVHYKKIDTEYVLKLTQDKILVVRNMVPEAIEQKDLEKRDWTLDKTKVEGYYD